jgi:penicillin-binding protein 2
VNATIGQGYMLVNPLQQAVMAARLASGRNLMPRLLMDRRAPAAPSLGIKQEHLDLIHTAMNEVVNGRGTAGKARLPVEGVQMAGKTGTAQVVGLNIGNGKGGLWKHRDHGHFICFAPFDKPRYAASVVVEHGGGSGAAYPIARDVMTCLFDQAKAMEVLEGYEKQWGGNVERRMAARYDAYAAKFGASAPKAPDEVQAAEAVAADNTPVTEPTAPQTDAAPPAPEPEASPSAAATFSSVALRGCLTRSICAYAAWVMPIRLATSDCVRPKCSRQAAMAETPRSKAKFTTSFGTVPWVNPPFMRRNCS